MKQINWKKYVIIAIVLIGSVGLGLGINRLFNQSGTNASPQKPTSTITQATLEEQYGIHVYLIAVTANGGMVDVRLNFVDAEKAKSLLETSDFSPHLLVTDSNVILEPSKNERDQEVKFRENNNFFLLYPNSKDAVKSGSSVRIVFGSIQTKPISVK